MTLQMFPVEDVVMVMSLYLENLQKGLLTGVVCIFAYDCIIII